MNRRRNNPSRAPAVPPVRVVSEGPEPGLIAAVPTSVRQAVRVAREYEAAYPGRSTIVTRGEKVLHRTSATGPRNEDHA